MQTLQPMLFILKPEVTTLNLSETDKAYLAGLIDGEGCISIAKHISKRTTTPIYHLTLIISSCDKDVLEFWKTKTELGAIKHARHSEENWRDGYSW